MATNQNRSWQFAGIADGYEKYLAPVLSKWTEELFEMAPFGPEDHVLDIASGTGAVVRKVAAQNAPPATLAALDVEPAMLEVARGVMGDMPFDVSWHEVDAGDMPFSDDSFDAAFCQQGLQFMDDPTEAMRETHRVLRRGGRLAVGVWSDIDDSPHYAVLADALQTHVDDRAAAAMRAPFEALSTPQKLRRCLESAGFEDVEVRRVSHDISYPSAEEFFRREVVSWLAEVVSEMSADDRDAVVGELEARLGEYIDDTGLNAPMTALLATGTKRS